MLLLFISTNLWAPVSFYIQGQAQEMVYSAHVREIDQRVESEPFSPELFYEALKIYVRNPDIAYRQAVLETGWFTHPRFTRYGNLFGMKPARSRESCQNGIWKHHATYSHWINSVKDYALWQDYWLEKGYDQKDYYLFLEELPYATAKRYTETLRLIELPAA